MSDSRATPSSGPVRPIVLGVAGGIGSGKSAVARMIGEHGFVVIDSDAEAKAALDLPEVRERLREWWGDRVIGADGRVDRAAVASIVFADPEQRKRLEGLVHPIVWRRREEVRAEAERAGARGVVIDAPLLFEAGLDEECDAVVFVDAPRDERLRRVRESRGWGVEELARREAAQWPVERKRGASRYVIHNHGSAEDLRRRVGELVATLPVPGPARDASRGGAREPRRPGQDQHPDA